MNNKKIDIFVLIFILFIILGFISFFFIAPLLLHIFSNCSYEEPKDHEIAGIILGAIATIVGIIVPLHYSIVLDIIGKLKNNKENMEEKHWVAGYILTSDILILVTGMFGGTVLLESFASFGKAVKLINFHKCSIIVAILYILLVVLGVSRSLFSSIKK